MRMRIVKVQTARDGIGEVPVTFVALESSQQCRSELGHRLIHGWMIRQ